MLDDELIGDSFDQFVEEKQRELRRVALQVQAQVADLYESALSSVLSLFESKLGLSRDYFAPGENNDIASVSIAALAKIQAEPDDDDLLGKLIKS